MGPVVTKRKKEKKIVKALVRNGIVEENRKNSLEMRVERKKKRFMWGKKCIFFSLQVVLLMEEQRERRRGRR